MHFFSVHPLPNMNDNPLIVPCRNRIDGGLDGFELAIAGDIDQDGSVGVELFSQEGRVDLWLWDGGVATVRKAMSQRGGDEECDCEGN